MTIRVLAIPVTLALAGLLGAGCAALPVPCDVTIAALPGGALPMVGDPLPADVLILGGPADFDQTATAIVVDAAGVQAIDLVLRGDAVARVAVHTTDHIGETMALAINGAIVALPQIQAPMLDGRIEISMGGVGGAIDLAKRFPGCVR